MLATRVIVALTVINDGLYRTERFLKPSYVGDPLNAIRIFNDKEVDELLVLDITPDRRPTDTMNSLFAKMAAQAFMPTSFGGGISAIEQMEELFYSGYDKIVINSAAIDNPSLVKEAVSIYGSQSVSISIDVSNRMFSKEEVVTNLGRKRTRVDPLQHAVNCEQLGVGEIIIRSVRHDGLMKGYDIDLINRVATVVRVPVVAVGGAGRIDDFDAAIAAGAQAVCAGSMFVYHGKHKAVLINYPGPDEFDRNISAVQRSDSSVVL